MSEKINRCAECDIAIRPGATICENYICSLQQDIGEQRATIVTLTAALDDVLASATPTAAEHPAMHAAWINAKAALAKVRGES